MSKAIYDVVDDVYRKVGKQYWVEDGVHRKITKSYEVVAGVYRLCWQGISSILEENTWADIQAIAAAGEAANYWSVGDTKAITINGKVGSYTFSNETYYAFIIGINHNESIEGKGIHFSFGMTSPTGYKIAFCDEAWYDQGSSAAFRMKTSANNSGGWKTSYMYKTICPAFLSALPSELQNVIVACDKYTDNTGSGTTASSAVTKSASKIWILAAYEVFGTYSAGTFNVGEATYLKQYDYYANGNNKVKTVHNNPTSATRWWLRSASTSNSTGYRVVHTDGTQNQYSANYSLGFAPCFMVG